MALLFTEHRYIISIFIKGFKEKLNLANVLEF